MLLTVIRHMRRTISLELSSLRSFLAGLRMERLGPLDLLLFLVVLTA